MNYQNLFHAYLNNTPAGYNLFEIKSSQTVSSRYLKALGFFEEISGESISSKTLIYAGSENQDRSAFRVRNWLDIPFCILLQITVLNSCLQSQIYVLHT